MRSAKVGNLIKQIASIVVVGRPKRAHVGGNEPRKLGEAQARGLIEKPLTK